MNRIILVGLLATSPAVAQAPGQGPEIAPFIDEHTLIVVRVDVSRVDLGTVFKTAAPFIGAGDETGGTVKQAQAWVKAFTAAGGKEVYVTYGAGDFPNFPSLIVPPPDAADRKALGQLLTELLPAGEQKAVSAEINGFVCAGTKDGLAVLRARKPVDRPDLAAALADGKDGVAQVAFALSAEGKKIHEQVAPTLPESLGGGSIQTLTRGMKWLSLSIGAGVKMPARLVMEAESPAAAGALMDLESRAQAAALMELLKPEGEADEAFYRRVKGVLDRRRTRLEDNRLIAEWDLATLVQDAVRIPAASPAERARTANNLKQLAIALHCYHDQHGRFPTDIRDADGKPLLSWRVHLLPYLEETPLYQALKLNEPWDSPNNKALISRMPAIFRSPRQADTLKYRTTYLAPLGKGFIWDDAKGIKIFDIPDGTSNTIMLVEADDDRAVIWSKPEDITIDRKAPTTGLLGHYGTGFYAGMADGSSRFIRKDMDASMIWALLTRGGGEVVEFPK